MTAPSLRAARAGDAPGITAVFLRARATMRYLSARRTEEETAGWVSNVLLTHHDVVVAEDADQVLGFVATGDGWLHHMYVDPAHQCRGIGSTLVDAVQQAHDSLQLWVFQRNEGAQEFYRRKGFRLRELTDGDRNEDREPDARYAWAT